jgi:hypothetical protein
MAFAKLGIIIYYVSYLDSNTDFILTYSDHWSQKREKNHRIT